jgi:chromate transporter
VTPGAVGPGEIAREWTRLGLLGFGGPPTHIRMLRELCVERRGWLDATEFEDALATCNVLPGPASTQLAIYCAWRVGGWRGGVIGALGFIVPGLVAILALAAVFLADSPPRWVLGAGASAGAAVAAVAVQAGWALVRPSWRRARSHARWALYAAVGAAAAATAGPWVVLALLACGGVDLMLRYAGPDPRSAVIVAGPAVLGSGRDSTGRASAAALAVTASAVGLTGLAAVAWTAFKVGALSYGGGFVIVPLMQADAVSVHGWMTPTQFLNAVALGQITPGPVTQTVAVVGYAAAGVLGGVLASVVAFAPSVLLILGGARRFDRLRTSAARSFLDGAGPAAIGAILGSAIPLARALTQPWQLAVLLAAAVLLLAARRGPVLTLGVSAAVGVVVALAGGPLAH